MFKSRPLDTGSVKLHSTHPLIEISANYADVPIVGENWSERWCVLPDRFDKIMEKIINFEVRKDDVFVVSFMKAGTTWMQETAFILLNDLDFEAAQQPFHLRSPFLDVNGIIDVPFDSFEIANQTKSPRLLKTHLPANLLPKQVWEKKPKIIYIARNAKDVICSSYHFKQGLGMFNGTINDFATELLKNQIQNTPFWEHVLDFWQLRNESNVFFITYEEMKRDLPNVLQKLSKFLGKPPLNEEQMQKVTEHLSFDKMRENKATNFGNNAIAKKLNVDKDFKFMRRGIVGSYKDELTPEMQQRVDEWTQKVFSKYNLKEEDIFGKL